MPTSKLKIHHALNYFLTFSHLHREGEAFGSRNALRERKFRNQVTTHQRFLRTLGLGDELLLKYGIVE